MAIIAANMPEDLRARLLDIVNFSFPGRLKFVDSKLEGFSNTHHSIHLSKYNRFSFRVCRLFLSMLCCGYLICFSIRETGKCHR